MKGPHLARALKEQVEKNKELTEQVKELRSMVGTANYTAGFKAAVETEELAKDKATKHAAMTREPPTSIAHLGRRPC